MLAVSACQNPFGQLTALDVGEDLVMVVTIVSDFAVLLELPE